MKKTILLAVPLLFSSNSVYGLTLQEAIAKVLTDSPKILAARASFDGYNEAVEIERADLMPTVSAYAEAVDNSKVVDKTDRSDTTSKKYSLTAEQTLFAGGANLFGYKAAQTDKEAARFSYEEVVQSTVLSLVEAYLDVLNNEQELLLQTKQVELLAKQLDFVNTQFKHGTVTKTDVKQAESRFASAQAAQILASGSLTIAKEALKLELGYLPETLSWPQLDAEVPSTKEEALKIATKNHPSLRQAIANLDSSNNRLIAAKGGMWPTVKATAGWSKSENASFGNATQNNVANTVGINVSLPIFNGGSTLSTIRKNVYARENSRETLETTRREVEEEATSAFFALQTAKAGLNSYKKARDAAFEAAEGVKGETKNGERSILDMLDSMQELLEAEVNITRSNRDVMYNTYRLLAAIGKIN